jgi:hypothetical protein
MDQDIYKKYGVAIETLRKCGGFDLSTGEKISLIRQTLRELAESPTITPVIKPKSP